MGHRIKAAALVVALVALVGCTATHGAPQRPVASVTSAAPDCRASDVVAQLLGGRGTPTPATTPGRVPHGFVPVAAVECSSAGGAREVVERRMSGDLAALVTTLDRPSDRVADVCPAMGQIQPVLYLVDAQGRTVRVAWPLDRCGYVQHRASDAVAALRVDSEQTLAVG